jgi:REP element-mobilizing transposase RayT
MVGNPLEYRLSYRRFLPHIQPPGATFFVTIRLAGSLPQTVINTLLAEQRQIEEDLVRISDMEAKQAAAYREQRRMFGRWDAELDTALSGPKWLAKPAVALVVSDSLHYLNGQHYELDTFCIMSNHVHIIFTPLADADGIYHALSSIMHSLKRHTARQANSLLNKSGRFWQPESYDHIVRDEEELARIREYVLNNPVKVGLVDAWDEWPWTYCAWQENS